jgi:glucose-like phosphotransferase system IIB component
MKDKVFEVLQRVGRAFMLPIALLPVAGLFLGIGASFTNPTVIETYHLQAILGQGKPLHDLFRVMASAGDVVFGNLPILFAIAVALAMANKEKATAALSGAVGFFIMHATISAMLDVRGWLVDGNIAEGVLNGAITTAVGIKTLNMGVFGGVLVGLVVGALTNRYYNKKLPDVIGFFSGVRFVPIVTAFTFLFVGILMTFVWPYIQNGISLLSHGINAMGYAGTFVYGLIERSLIPFGLHHVFYLPFWQTSLGGEMMVAGQLVEGGQNIFFAQLADPNTVKFNVEATKWMTGKFPFMMFGLPAVALAFYHTAAPAKRKVVASLVFSAALTAFLTGITEPIEFTFLFVAPILYVIHAVLAGLSFMLMHILQVGVGQTFSGGFIDFFLFGVLQGNARTNWLYIVIVGLIYAPIYYFLFRFLIIKLDLATPGREKDGEEVKLYTRSDVDAKKGSTAKPAAGGMSANDEAIGNLVVSGLGGADNILNVDCCASRLRISLKDGTLINEDLLKQSGSRGIILAKNGIQVVYGTTVSGVKAAVDHVLGYDE